MLDIPIYSIIAYSGTGKTTLLERLIPELKGKGLRVAVFKHDAHDFEIDHQGKDSWRMTKAGADITVISSNSKTAIMENRPVSIEALISRVSDVDIILTEGYKHGSWKKICVYRQTSGKPLASNPDDCFVIMTDTPIDTQTKCLDINDILSLSEIILSDLRKNS